MPPFKNHPGDGGSYHWYGILDFLAAEPRLGTEVDLVNLVRRAQDQCLHVILHVVVEHVGDVFTYAGEPDRE